MNLPMFEQHTGNMIFIMFDILPSVICPNRKENILAVLTDGARNMTRRYQGVMTFLENASTNTLVWLLCASYQINLVMG